MTEKDYCQNIDCTCENKCLSPVIDAELSQRQTLQIRRADVMVSIRDVEERHRKAKEAELDPLYFELDAIDAALDTYRRPGCFGSMTCSDRDYEFCNSSTVKACQAAVRAGWV